MFLNVSWCSILPEFVTNSLLRDHPYTPECDHTVECEHSWLHRLDMTGTDEHCNSRSHDGTPTWGGTPVPQPVFQPSVGFNEGHRHLPASIPDHPPYGDDPFRANSATEAHHSISLNDDVDEMSQMQMPVGRNAVPLPIPNVQGGAGPLSQEGRLFEWQLGPLPVLPGPPPMPQPSPPPAPQPNPLPAPSQNLPPAQSPARRVAGA